MREIEELNKDLLIEIVDNFNFLLARIPPSSISGR